MALVDLIWLSNDAPAPAWKLGAIATCRWETGALVTTVEKLVSESTADAILFWDASLGLPSETIIEELIGLPGDCWHSGLKLGMGGLPGIMDFVSPGWMLGCDAPAEIESTSWRLSLRACLVRTEVLRKLGGLRPEFLSVEGASLEMSYRWIRRGALMRHVPRLISMADGRKLSSATPKLPFEDETRFALYRNGRKWAGWGLFRAVMTRRVSVAEAFRAWRKVMRSSIPRDPAPLRSAPFDAPSLGPDALSPSVTILIPTVDRYPYLRTLLGQLRQQTVAPYEIIVVDQTAAGRRDDKFVEEFKDLPIKWIVQDEPGQCTSRNAGLHAATGDCVLFIDDDDEVEPDLIAAHLRTLATFQVDVSSGVADEVGAGELPADFKLLRASDVFPTNNTMIRREVLRASGLFDLAYNRRPRADGDLGMRIHLSGARMILNPSISVLHHHAPSGGLRKHKARTVTYAMSRNSLLHRVLSSTSEIYLVGRYFPRSHSREMLWQSGLGTFSIRGPFIKKATKVLISAVVLPMTIWELRNRVISAREIAKSYPSIDKLA